MSNREVIIDGVKYVPEVDPLAEVKAAFEAGKTIQFRPSIDPEWRDFLYSNPAFGWPDFEWRIKPEKKPDYSICAKVVRDNPADAIILMRDVRPHNLRLTFDGETGKLKSAEVL